MKKLFIILFFLPITLQAEWEFDFNGYIYDIPTLMFPDNPDTENTESSIIKGNSILSVEDNNQQTFESDSDILGLNITKVRLRPELAFDEDKKLVMHYEIDMLNTKTILPYLSNVEMTNRQAVDLSWSLTNQQYLSVNHLIDRLYYKSIHDWGEYKIGRQRIAWGVGRIWQTTDLFNPINPANFSKLEKDGADAISVKYYLGMISDIEFVVNFRDKLDKTNVGARLRTNYEEFDLSLLGGLFDNNITVGTEFAGNLFDAGVRGEFLVRKNSKMSGEAYFSVVLGADYQFTSDLYALIEFHHNGLGTTSTDEYIDQIDKLMKGEIQNLAKNYAAASLNYQLHPLVTLTFSTINNLDDQSGYLSLLGAWSVSEDFNASLGAMKTYGSTGGEYSLYPTSLYFLLAYYF